MYTKNFDKKTKQLKPRHSQTKHELIVTVISSQKNLNVVFFKKLHPSHYLAVCFIFLPIFISFFLIFLFLPNNNNNDIPYFKMHNKTQWDTLHMQNSRSLVENNNNSNNNWIFFLYVHFRLSFFNTVVSSVSDLFDIFLFSSFFFVFFLLKKINEKSVHGGWGWRYSLSGG